MLKLNSLLVLGGAGLIGSEVVKDLAETSKFKNITVADKDYEKVSALVKSLDDRRFSSTQLDIKKKNEVVAMMRNYDLVCNCLPFAFDTYITQCCYEAGVTGTDLGATKEQLEMHDMFMDKGLLFVVCDGISPGTSNMIAAFANNKLDRLDEVHIAFASYRAIRTAPGLVRTTLWELDPNETGRSYYANGKQNYVGPFTGEKIVDFPPPFGPQPTYYVPHNEVYTIPSTMPSVKVCTIRGAWTPKQRRMLKFLNDYGFYTTKPVKVGDSEIAPIDFIEKFIFANDDFANEEIWGFCLTVDCIGLLDGKETELRFYTTTPGQDEWGIPACYAKSTACSMSVGVQLLARGISCAGVRTPDEVYDAEEYLDMLKERKVILHERSGRFGLPT
jgi:saccharopine dehydrogenase-like NADP-dependent oxidoreductase